MKVNKSTIRYLKFLNIWQDLPIINLIILLAVALSIDAAAYSYVNGYMITYGDAESHLNIAKRVIHSLTPGFSQLGGIWLPLPHVMMLPFVYFDSLWRSGLAGWMVSGICFVIGAVFIYKTTILITKDILAAFVAFLVFALNPNILYMQSTAMTELTLIMFFILSTYFYIKFLKDDTNILSLIFAALFGFCATLSRYDGWFLVLCEAGIIVAFYLFKRTFIARNDSQHISFLPSSGLLKMVEGKFILFSSLAFFGIFLWIIWDFLILGDPLYFKNSQFSAQSQQLDWLARGELPAYKNIFQSFLYYSAAALRNAGIITFLLGVIGLVGFILYERGRVFVLSAILLILPFIFNILSLFLGQSVIFIPDVTPGDFEWYLFNVRYGLMMIPAIAFFIAYLFYKVPVFFKNVIILLLILQTGIFAMGYEKVISWEDGVIGLSASKSPDAQLWLTQHYDDGLVLIDDYARTISIIKSGLPMQNVIYIGNKPYWEDSLREPEKHAKWIVMQEGDSIWREIYKDMNKQGRLFKYFQKVYTSPDILIFKRNELSSGYEPLWSKNETVSSQ